MFTKVVVFLCGVLFSFTALANQTPCHKRIMIAPLENGSRSSSQDYLSIGLPLILATQLDRQGFDVVAVDEELAMLYKDPASLTPEARTSADIILKGRFDGTREKWRLRVDSYDKEGLRLAGTSTSGSQLVTITKKRSGKKVSTPSMRAIYAMFAYAALESIDGFCPASLNDARRAMSVLPTTDFYALYRLMRAYNQYYFEPETEANREKIIALAKTAVNIDPHFSASQIFYAAQLEEAGQHIRARVHFAEAVKYDPGSAQALLGLGRLEESLGNHDAAIDWLKKAIKIAPNSPQGYYWLARARASNGENVQAIGLLERTVQLDPNNLNVRKDLGALYAKTNDFQKARAQYVVATRLFAKDAESWHMLAACERRLGKYADAANIYEAASRVFSDEARWQQFEADMLSQIGQNDEATTHYVRARGIAKAHPRENAFLTAKTPPLPIPQLVQIVGRDVELHEELERLYRDFSETTNDGIATLRDTGKDGCSISASSIQLTKSNEKDHEKNAQSFLEIADAVRIAKVQGLTVALTPDENDNVEMLIGYVARVKRDQREMRARKSSLLGLRGRYKCPNETPSVDPTLADIRKRNDTRLIKVEKKPGAEPTTTKNLATIVRINVENQSKKSRSYTIKNTTELTGIIGPESTKEIEIDTGPHKACSVLPGQKCSDDSWHNIEIRRGTKVIIR